MQTAHRVLACLDEEYLFWLLRRLVQIPSVNPPGRLAPIATFVAEELCAQGLQVEVAGDVGQGWERPNVLAFLPGERPEWGVLFSAHTDVVPAYDLHLWRHHPFAAEVADGVLFGRGAADCKGSLAAMMAALRALKRAGLAPVRSVALLAWAGDEWHPPEARWFNGETYMATHGYLRPAPYVGGEPYDLTICCASRGRVWAQVEVAGKSAHAASGAGVNAILAAVRIIKAVYALPRQNHPLLGRDTVSVGTIRGGQKTNTVPDRCELVFDIRFAPPRTTAEVMALVREAAQAEADRSGAALRRLEFPERREPIEFPAGGGLVRALQEAGRAALGRELPLGGAVSFGDIADWKDRVGITEACLFGPGETAQAHAVDEHVALADVAAAARVYALAALRRAGAG
ncbi:MAG: M20/M25/M40 family metallo-hydrolase [Armatimonadota bacterium]|nr:M20/M25/M40 family metallo-hydrolase [Armatimonadota bacterium]MDR7426340.1 M20/M25/M40 family metallo-hydrolase [Armatimonadota bacterium]MDR7464950.1 M20/M25/M40 family metallo-hydrolase [Armatimonadota bacterium]MDR7469176.1 M20/M25/M40 family metallo-hydrolase [Armatimonadota bacterium]MDR7474553.1 M20/M25/M40 family metallo-hydrolase [Armatimonadota bacterium]